ncbi:ATP-binding protein [Streptomyces acidicola]|uniref:sensor histidine kinase n=1 Tax=Streptomyces acidicola TaxID=2596892 RepID=UPI0037BCA6EA
MSTNEAGTPSPERPAPRNRTRGVLGIRGFADRWPFRRKLNILVGVPLAVVAVLLAYLITDQVGQARDADAAARLVRDSVQVAVLVDRVEVEHQQAILLSVRHEADQSDAGPSPAAYRKAQADLDAQVEKVRDTFGDRLPDTEAQALREIDGLDDLRRTIESGYTPADNIDPAYISATKSVIDGLGLEHNAALAASFTGNLLDSLLHADASHSAFETSVFSARTGDSNALIEFINAVSFDEQYAFQADRFRRFATEAQSDELSGIRYNPSQATILQHYAELQIEPGGLQAESPAEIRRAFDEALDSYPVYREQAENRLKITTSLIGQIADGADHVSEASYERAVGLLGLALLGFVGWLAFSVAVRRSVVMPVQALTGAAREVADVAGRELARVADDDAEDAGPPRLREMPVTARDEIGELAGAFNRVQTTAAALLERQVLSRRNVAEMFGNVGRRVSNLTTRQLSLIDAVERGETDPALLERLYSIDHIAVRLRRNADSLMLLAGIRETVLDSGPASLTDVVRAALGQIEGFQRVRLTARTQVMVEPDIIGDLTLMVAELLENAVSFSPADSHVEVGVSSTAEGALIEVADHGLGMSPERLAEENARLVRRERLDLAPTKVLGLFVVGTLARRWGIEVTLARTVGGGLTALVTVPTSLLLTMSPVGVEAAGASDGSGTADEGVGGSSVTAGAGAAATSVTAETGASETSVTARAGAAATSVPVAAMSSRADGGAGAAPQGSPEPSAPSGPLPSTVVPAGAADAGRPAALPHRVPRRATEPADGQPPRPAQEPSAGLPFVPGPRSGDATSAPRDAAKEAPGGSARPLRRRVRGATLRTADTSGHAARQAARPADAEAVRSQIEEFEAAVERAHRDSAAATDADTGPAGTTAQDQPSRDHRHHQHDLPEGAEQ